MIFGRLQVAGLLVVLGATAGCGAPAEAEPPVPDSRSAVAAYTPPAGAPGLCASLAGTTEVTGLPAALGILSVDPRDVEAKLDVAAGIDELRTALRSSADDGDTRLVTAVEDLVRALGASVEGPLTRPDRAAVHSTLDALGAVAQPVCRFPA